MKNYIKLTALLLSLLFLCSCNGVTTNTAPPTEMPSISASEEASTSNAYADDPPIGVFEENGKYYLDLEYQEGRYDFIGDHTGYPQYITEFTFSSLEELLQKWQNGKYTEGDLFWLQYVLWDGKDRIQILDPNALFYPSNEEGLWEDAQVIWDPRNNIISFRLKGDNYHEQRKVTIWYAEKCETIEEAWQNGYGDTVRWYHEGAMDCFAELSYPGGGEFVSIGDIDFLKCNVTSSNIKCHYHYQSKTSEGRTHYLCMVDHLVEPFAKSYMFTIFNGYFVLAESSVWDEYGVLDNYYEIVLDPLISIDFLPYSPAEE